MTGAMMSLFPASGLYRPQGGLSVAESVKLKPPPHTQSEYPRRAIPPEKQGRFQCIARLGGIARSPRPGYRSRLPFSFCSSGARNSRRHSSTVSQLPNRTPSLLAPFTRWMPAASSGLSNRLYPLSYLVYREAFEALPEAFCSRSQLAVVGSWAVYTRVYDRLVERGSSERCSQTEL
jgi:hypothetical protein